MSPAKNVSDEIMVEYKKCFLSATGGHKTGRDLSWYYKDNSMRHFTQYCPNEDWFAEQEILEREPGARLFDYTASSLFRRRGVAVGDSLYLVTVLSGKLFLAGKMEIGEIVSLDEARRRFPGERLFQVPDHLFARRVTPLDYTRSVPVSITARLLFYKSGNLAPLKFSKPGWLDSQTLRGIREMPQKTAETLDALLPPPKEIRN
jgi:hypothetical protein